MNNSEKIREQFSSVYKRCKDKNGCNDNDANTMAALLIDMTFLEDNNYKELAEKLISGFSLVTEKYFVKLCKDDRTTNEIIDSILEKLLQTNVKGIKPELIAVKYSSIINSLVNFCKMKNTEINNLPKLIVKLSASAVNNTKSRKKFAYLIKSTNGKIFLLSYESLNKTEMETIQKAIKITFNENDLSKYDSIIKDWEKKYGFVSDEAETKEISENDKKNKETEPKPTVEKKAVISEQEKSNKIENISSLQEDYIFNMTRKLYSNIKKDLIAEQEAIISAVNATVEPLSKAVNIFQDETKKNTELSAENTRLIFRINELEKQIAELNERVNMYEEKEKIMLDEKNTAESKISELEIQADELNAKLKDAYSINSREASLEAEKIRSDIKKAFVFLYEDWLEYEFSDVNEDNYTSLQAIIKKAFRALERNGIDFKESNQ